MPRERQIGIPEQFQLASEQVPLLEQVTPVFQQEAPRYFSAEDATSFFANHEGTQLVDTYSGQLEELFLVRNPQIDPLNFQESREYQDFMKKRDIPEDGTWVYFPWKNEMRHLLGKEEFIEVLFSRNYPTISRDEQQALGDTSVFVAGLSVGGSIVDGLARIGIMKLGIADGDIISLSNLPRLRSATTEKLGVNKTLDRLHSLYEFNPYLTIEYHLQGLTLDSLEDAIKKYDIVVDCMDSFPMKNTLRDIAKQQNHWIVMATDFGFSPPFDVEGANRPKFGGRITEEKLVQNLSTPPTSKQEATQRVVDIMGIDNIPTGALQSILNVLNGTQNSWSQVAPTSDLVSAQVSYLVLQIAKGNGDKLPQTFTRTLELPQVLDKTVYQETRQELERKFNENS